MENSNIEILLITKIPEKRRGFKYIPIEKFVLEETEGKRRTPHKEKSKAEVSPH